MRIVLAGLALAGCSSPAPGADDVVEPDAMGVTESCSDTDAFGTSSAVGGLTDATGARFSPDQRTVWYSKNGDLFEATRSSDTGSFSGEAPLTNLNMTSADEIAPSVAGTTLSMVFASDRGNTFDLFLADRDTTADQFAVVSQIVGTNTGFSDTFPHLAADGSELWFASDRDGDFDIYRATVSGSSFGNTAAVAAVNAGGTETDPVLSDDGLTLYFSRDGAIFSATRATATGTFGDIGAVTELGNGSPLWLSPGGCRIYFESAGVVRVAEKPSS